MEKWMLAVQDATEKERIERLMDILSTDMVGMAEDDQQKVTAVLLQRHKAFVLSDAEKGMADLVQFHIDTGDAFIKKQPACRVPFAVRQEVERQLKKMQEMGVVQPSCSPWASPIVLV